MRERENHLRKREGKNLIRFQMKDTCGEVKFIKKLTLHDNKSQKLREIRLIISFAGMKATQDYWEQMWTRFS